MGACPVGHMNDRPLTVEQLIGDYCRAKGTKKIRVVESLLLRGVLPAWRDREAASLARPDLMALLKPYAPAMQMEIRKNVVAMFNWALGRKAGIDMLSARPSARC